MQTSPTFFNTLLLGFLLFQNCVLAAKAGAKKEKGDDGGGGGGNGGGGGDSGGSDSAPPLDTAILVVGGIAAFFAAIIGLASYKCCFRRVYMHNKRNGEDPTRSWNTGGAFWLLAMLGMGVLVAHYILLAAQLILEEDTRNSPIIAVNAMIALTSDMADIIIASAFFSLLHRRQSVHFTETTSTWKTTFKIGMILLMLAFAAVKAALGCLVSTFESQSTIQILIDLFHVYTTLYIVTTATIIVSAFSLRKRLIKADIEDQVVLARVCRWVCPYLAIEASFRLAYEIVASLPSQQEQQHINIDALILVDIIIKYSAYIWSVVVIGNDAGPRSRLRAPTSVTHH